MSVTVTYELRDAKNITFRIKTSINEIKLCIFPQEKEAHLFFQKKKSF